MNKSVLSGRNLALGTIAFCTLVSSAFVANAGTLAGLVAHRAVYDIKLSDSSDRSGIKGMDGRIVYEIVGSACEGFAVKFRFVSRIDTGRKSFVTDQRTTTFEDAKGENFRFLTRSFVNEQFEKEVRGSANRTGSSTKVVLNKPEKRELKLGNSIFMTNHLATVIEKARKGENLFIADIFDGSDNADELMSTTTIIGRKSVDAPKGIDSLQGTPNWPVSISYFSLKDEQKGESLPVYQVAFDLYENGISGNLTMKYADYSLKGKLTRLEILPSTPCEQ